MSTVISKRINIFHLIVENVIYIFKPFQETILKKIAHFTFYRPTANKPCFPSPSIYIVNMDKI